MVLPRGFWLSSCVLACDLCSASASWLPASGTAFWWRLGSVVRGRLKRIYERSTGLHHLACEAMCIIYCTDVPLYAEVWAPFPLMLCLMSCRVITDLGDPDTLFL